MTMLEQLEKLEIESRKFDTSSEEFFEWMEACKEPFQGFMKDIEKGDAIYESRQMAKIDATPNDLPTSFQETMDYFFRECLNTGFNPSSGRFFGYVPGGGLPSAAMGDFVAALTNRYSGVYAASPGAVEIENLCVNWLCGIVGYPKTSHGALLSGGTLSTLTCVVVARNSRKAEAWLNSTIYISSEIHQAIDKSLMIAGLAGVATRKIPVDENFRIGMSALKRMIAEDQASGLNPWMIFSSAGTINTGAVDPFNDLADLCEEQDIWLHVDGAYGGCFAMLDEVSQVFAGLHRADSIVLDPHKAMFMPYGCGAALVKDGKLMQRTFSVQADYLTDVAEGMDRSPAEHSIELTRHFRALRLWFSVKIHGMDRYRAALREKLLLCQYLQDKLGQMAAVEVGPEPVLSIMAFRLKSGEEDTIQLLQQLIQRRRIHLSSTRLNGVYYCRICVLNFRSHKAEVDELLAEVSDVIRVMQGTHKEN